jgi:hypothetical protein
MTVLSACAEPRLPPGGVAALDGLWEGQSALTYGARSCAETVPYVFNIRAGTVYGEIHNPRRPTEVMTKFEAFIETDGRMLATVRPAGEPLYIQGRFVNDTFVGETKSEACSGRLALRRRS